MTEFLYIAPVILMAAVILVLVAPRLQPHGVSTKTVSNLIQRVGELETQLETERQACSERIQAVMRQMLRTGIRLDMLDGGEEADGGAVHLYNEMVNHLSENEIQLLAFDMNVNYESFGGDNAHAKALNMIIGMKRAGRVDDMIRHLNSRRADVNWGG